MDACLSPSSDWVRRFIPEIPQNAGPVLDLACGSGRHTRLLLDAGYEVYSLDLDPQLVAPLSALGAQCFEIDLERDPIHSDHRGGFNWPFRAQQFAGVVVTNYLYRPLFPSILNSLKHQGILIYETFAKGHEQFGRPRNPDFLLNENELLNEFVMPKRAGWQQKCLAFEQTFVNREQPAFVQRVCVQTLELAQIDHIQSE